MRRLQTILWTCGLLAVATGCLAQGAAPAPALRDPTLAPATTAPDGTAVDGGAVPASPLGAGNVVVRGGKSYLVVGSRLVAPGQMVDNYKLERITETEIWWRDETGRTKQPRYAGVQRSVAKPHCGAAAPASAPAAGKKKSPTGASARPATPPSTDAGTRPRSNRENDAHDC